MGESHESFDFSRPWFLVLGRAKIVGVRKRVEREDLRGPLFIAHLESEEDSEPHWGRRGASRVHLPGGAYRSRRACSQGKREKGKTVKGAGLERESGG